MPLRRQVAIRRWTLPTYACLGRHTRRLIYGLDAAGADQRQLEGQVRAEKTQ